MLNKPIPVYFISGILPFAQEVIVVPPMFKFDPDKFVAWG